MNKAIKIGLVLVVVLAVAIGGAYAYYKSQIAPVDHEGSVAFYVEPGSSVRAIAELLENEGVIRNADAFTLYIRLTGYNEPLRSGLYDVQTPVQLDELLDILSRGGRSARETVTVVIPEGLKVEQIVSILTQAGLGDREVYLELASQGAFDYPFLEYPEDPRIGFRLEGFLFPDTYQFYADATEEQILGRMLARFDEVLTPEFRSRADELGMSVLEIVTMASIVEKEAVKADERPRIAGVFYNRLDRGIRFESCATVQFLFEEPKERLFNRDLEIESPYNTYLNAGFPPGPIAAPGRASLEAALWPEEHDYLFFVARSDGSHAFNRTYAGHLEDKNAGR